MRFDGTDTALMILPSAEHGEIDGKEEDFEKAFKRAYRSEFGFVLDSKNVVVDDVKVRGTGKTFDSLGPSVFSELSTLEMRAVAEDKIARRQSVFFDPKEGGRKEDTPVYELDKLDVGEEVRGPAVVIDDTQTIVVVPGARAVVTRRHLVIKLGEDKN